MEGLEDGEALARDGQRAQGSEKVRPAGELARGSARAPWPLGRGRSGAPEGDEARAGADGGRGGRRPILRGTPWDCRSCRG